MALSIGQILNNRYRIDKILGQGGFGAVYQALDLNLERAYALKENLQVSPEAQRQFRREALLLAGLSHPNLPRVTDHFVIQGQGQYLVMDFVDGEDLQTMLNRQGRLSEAQALAWIAHVCDALEYLHTQNPPVIHRDIKPANIRIRADGRAVLVDFGIAKTFDAGQATTLGAKAVTPGFSPPEQYGQGAPTDGRSDVYALGATLYALLTGSAPPDSIDVITGSAPASRPVKELAPGVSPHTGAAIEKAMALDRQQRWRSAQEFKQALQPRLNVQVPAAAAAATYALPHPPPAAPVGATYALPRPASAAPPAKASAVGVQPPGASWSRWMLPAGLALAALTLGLCLIVGAAWLSRRFASTQPRLTQTAAAQALLAAEDSGDLSKPPAQAQAGASWKRPADGMSMQFVPPGEVLMGSTGADPDASADEKPQRIVTLEAFWIDRTEVTNAMYARCVAAGKCPAPAQTKSATRPAYYGAGQYADFPVIYVSWQEARTYCQWAGGDLPSEAQWERAARDSDGRLYPWGSAAPDCKLANFAGCNGDTLAVGSNPGGASPYGVLDLAGNVYEWVLDWYQADYYQAAPAQNPPGPASGTQRVLRGGSWYSQPKYIRLAYRYGYDPAKGSDLNGFRCVR